MKEIKCPYDLNQFLLGEPMFENTFPEEECKMRKFYGDCFHCFATAIASRDHQLKNAIQNFLTDSLLEVRPLSIDSLQGSRCKVEDTVEQNLIKDDACKEIEQLSPVTPKERTGHWIYKLEDWNKWTCSECGFSKRTDVHVKLRFNFCPNCGCRMINRKE